jgi:hypothetical protein
MVLTYCENDGFTNLVSDWVTQSIFYKCLANAVRFFREKLLFKISEKRMFRFLLLLQSELQLHNLHQK